MIVLSGEDCSAELKEHVRIKQEQLLDKIKQKRASSLASAIEETGRAVVEINLPSAVYSCKKIAIETEYDAPPSVSKVNPLASDRSFERENPLEPFFFKQSVTP